MSVEETILNIVWPEGPITLDDEHGNGRKIVQLLFDDKPTLLIGPKNTYHADMLTDFLQSQGIEITLQHAYYDETKMIPSRRGERYLLRGAGRALLDTEKKVYGGCHDKSIDYNLPIRTDHEKLFATYLKEQNWTFTGDAVPKSDPHGGW